MTNPFIDYLNSQAAALQVNFDAQYANELAAFNAAVASYQANAERQWYVDQTIIPAPKVPVKKVAYAEGGVLKETTWTDPNLHSPVFVKPTPPPASGLPDISGGVTPEQLASMLVAVAQKLDKIMLKLGI